jgi:hypothetical protein
MQRRRTGEIIRLTAYAVLLLAGAVCTVDAAAPEDVVAQRADQLKAGYLLNFMKFVDWPEPLPANLLTVCFVGGKGVRDALEDGLQNKTVRESHLILRMLAASEPPVGCNVLYLASDSLPAGAQLRRTDESPILTVSDVKEFAHSGGMIELFTDANHLRFNINVVNAQRARLHISSSLLQLAAIVEQDKP